MSAQSLRYHLTRILVKLLKRMLWLSLFSLLVWLTCLKPIGQPRPFYQSEFDKVVSEIQAGALQPDRRGVVILPARQSYLSATGKVYIKREEPSTLIVFFPAWVGRQTLLVSPLDASGDRWLEGYVFDSSSPSDFIIGDYSSGGHWILLGPAPVPFWQAKRDNEVEQCNLFYSKRISPHWFYADIFS